MISDQRAVDLITALYYEPTSSIFTHVDMGTDDGICFGISQSGEGDEITFRGSKAPEDWILDSMAAPHFDARFGGVHHGFFLGMDRAWNDIRGRLRSSAPVYLTGHSLGAARAAVLCGIMVADNKLAAGRIIFGEPKPGFQRLADYCKNVPTRNYCNGNISGHDIVTELPLTLARIGLNYVHSTPLISIEGDPDPNDASGLFVYHHWDLYSKAIARRES